MAHNLISFDRGQTKRQNSRRHSEPTLEVPSAVFNEATLRGLIEECLVPAMVDRFLEEQGSQPKQRAA